MWPTEHWKSKISNKCLEEDVLYNDRPKTWFAGPEASTLQQIGVQEFIELLVPNLGQQLITFAKLWGLVD